MGVQQVLANLCVLLIAVCVDCSAVDFDDKLAKFAFDHAAAAYAKNPRKCLRKYNATRLIRRETAPCDAVHDECWYFISVAPDMIVVSFRGTKKKLQLITEIVETMTEPKTKFPAGGAVQHYFSSAVNVIWPNISSTLLRLHKIYPNHGFLFTGHSLGGAIASLVSTQFAFKWKDEVSGERIWLFTFGQPRVGNQEYAFAHDRLVPNSFRLVHRYDLVPHLPYCVEKLWSHSCTSLFNHGPYHHGTEIWFPGQMSNQSLFRVCLSDPKNEDDTCSNSCFPHYSVNDHLFYFDEHVSDYGIAGCISTKDRYF